VKKKATKRTKSTPKKKSKVKSIKPTTEYSPADSSNWEWPQNVAQTKLSFKKRKFQNEIPTKRVPKKKEVIMQTSQEKLEIPLLNPLWELDNEEYPMPASVLREVKPKKRKVKARSNRPPRKRKASHNKKEITLETTPVKEITPKKAPVKEITPVKVIEKVKIEQKAAELQPEAGPPPAHIICKPKHSMEIYKLAAEIARAQNSKRRLRKKSSGDLPGRKKLRPLSKQVFNDPIPQKFDEQEFEARWHGSYQSMMTPQVVEDFLGSK